MSVHLVRDSRESYENELQPATPVQMSAQSESVKTFLLTSMTSLNLGFLNLTGPLYRELKQSNVVVVLETLVVLDVTVVDDTVTVMLVTVAVVLVVEVAVVVDV